MCGPCAAYADKAVTILEELWAVYPAKKHGGSEAEREAWREDAKELLSCLQARARQPKQEALVIASMIKGAKITGHTPPELVHYVVKEGDPVPPRAPTVRERNSSGTSRPTSVKAFFTAATVGPNTALRFSRDQAFEPTMVSSEPWKRGMT